MFVISPLLLVGGLANFPAAAAPTKVAASSTIKWNDYNTGLNKARQQKKFVLLQFYATWCGYCRKMDQTTFQDSSVKKVMDRWFVPIRVTEKSTNNVTYQGKTMQEDDLLPAYQVTGFPTLVFLDPDGQRLTKLPGYMGPAEFDTMLKYIGTRSYEKMDMDEFKKKFAKFLKQ